MDIALVVVITAAAIGAVLWPLVRRDAGAPDGAPPDDGMSADELAREVSRYRAALRAGTVCARCREASPPGSRFCAACGRALRGRKEPDAARA